MRTAAASPTSVLRLTLETICLAALYYAGARMGLALAFGNTNASPVWPPAGIALAAMLLLGPRMWVGVWLGAFAANVVAFSEREAVDSATATWLSSVIAFGNTLGALVGWSICRRWLGRDDNASARIDPGRMFGTISVFQFLVAASGAALASGLVGPLAVCAAQIGAWDSYWLIAFTWWSGDATGILYATPFLISLAPLLPAWRTASLRVRGADGSSVPGQPWKRFWEPLAALVVLAAVSWTVFATPHLRDFPAELLKVLPFAIITWIAVRMGVRTTTFALMILAVMVVWSGKRFFGNLAEIRDLQNVLVWVAFLWVVGLMFLALASKVEAHRETLASLRKANAALEATMDAIPALVVVAHDSQCQRVTGNARAHELLHLPESRGLSPAPGESDMLGGEWQADDGASLMDSLAMRTVAVTGRPVLGQELELNFPDGDVRYIYGNSVPLLDERGVPRGCVAAFVDVTERRRVEGRLNASQQQLADDLSAMACLQQVSTRLMGADDYEGFLPEILDAAITISHADKGNIQLLHDGLLRIVAQRGFDPPFLEHLNTAQHDEAAWGTAARHGARLIVEDVVGSPVFAGRSSLPALLDAGVRAMQSTPLVSRSGRVVGLISTHYHTPQRPDEQVLRVLDILARQAADLIERTQTERALRESEERFRTMADVAPVMIWMSGVDKRCAYVNMPWLEFTGLSMEQAVDLGWSECVHPDDFHRWLEKYNASFDARVEFKIEYRLRRYDGEYRWLLDHGVPRFDSAGEFAGYIGSCVDITERKQVESDMTYLLDLSDRRRQAGTAEEVVAGAVDTLGPHLGVDTCWFATVEGNEGDTFLIRREHQSSAGTVAGTYSMNTFGPEVARRLRGGSFVAVTDIWRDERTAPRAEGCQRLGIGACAIVPILRESRLVALMALASQEPRLWSHHDISMLRTVTERMWLSMERLRLAEQLGESEARFRTMAEWVPAFIFTMGADGGVDYVNERFCEFTGLRPRAVAGNGWLQTVHPEDRTRVAELWRDSIATGQPYSAGLRIASREGAFRWFHSHAHPVHDEGGQIVKWFGSCADIDELMRSKSELQALNEKLEERVNQRTAQLKEANRGLLREFQERQRLEREMLEISEKERRVLGQDLHDGLCQHLSGLAFMAETLSSKLRDKGLREESAKLDGLIELIRSAASQARAVAKGLHPVDVDANGLVAALKDLAARHSIDGKVRCSLVCSRPVPLQENRVALHLYRIAQEAVVNALKHAGATQIVIELAANGGQIDLTVSDDGHGMPDHRKLNGGMGLHLMQYRAGVIGGTLKVRNSDTGGTLVTCQLPIAEAEEADTSTGPVPLIVRKPEIAGEAEHI